MRAGWMILLVLMASACRESAKPQAAATAPATSTEVSAENIEKSLAAAQEYITTNDLGNALAILLTLIDRAPNEVRGHELLGQVYAMQAEHATKKGDSISAKSLFQQASAEYAKAVALEPNSAGLHHSAGLMALAAGDSNVALQCFQKAGQLDPKNPQHPLFEAQLLIQAKRFDDAIAALNRVLSIDKDEAIAHASLAMIAVEQNRFDEAIKFIIEARRIQPDDVGLRAQEAKVWRRRGDPRRALELMVGLSPSDRAKEVVATEIAAAHTASSDHRKAALAWEHCVKTDPLNPRVWMWQVWAGESLLKAGEREQAYLWLQQAKTAAPDAAEVKGLEAAIAQGK